MSREAKILIGILVVVVGGMIGLFVFANQSSPPPVGDKTKIIRENSHKEGTGEIQLVEFGDYQCPACGNAHPNLQQIMKDYAGKVTFYFRNFPLTQLHANATLSSNAAEAAAAQGKFWQMHDKLYETQKEWSELPANDAKTKLNGYAKSLGLDTDKFNTAISDSTYQDVIDQDVADGNALNIQGTPTIYVNGKAITGYAYADIRDAIEAALKK